MTIKRISTLVLFLISVLCLHAGMTTYTFTSATWTSRVGTDKTDLKTDGWISQKDAFGYESSTNPNFQTGAKVTSAYSGAGATSVRSFTSVRRLTFNYATTTKGAGSIRVQVGNNEPIDSVLSISTANHDITIVLPEQQTGNISFSVVCTKNSIYLSSVTIRAEEGGGGEFLRSRFELVTDVKQLQDSDQIIIGVKKEGVPYIMGYFDETVSQNNIHAIKGVYTPDRTSIGTNDEAIYTLHRTTLNGQTAWIIQDEIRYEEAYLVANGGRTKNKLALWTSVYDGGTYGNYGYWSISVQPDGTATIMNLGNSLGKYLQYNASNSPTLFACYQTEGSQTPVCIYRETAPIASDSAVIIAPLVQFGTIVMNGETTGSKTITVNANRLSEDIHAYIKGRSSIFSVSSELLDRDGDNLTLSYKVKNPGKYCDTLVLESGMVRMEVSVLLTAIQPIKIAEAVAMPDYATAYLQPVVVTKKFDTYIFVRDETGSMLIYDNGDGASGKRYGADVKTGDVLTGVVGRFSNYYGVPELAPYNAFSIQSHGMCEPETVVTIDSADVCRYVRLTQVTIDENNRLNGVSCVDKFNAGITPDRVCTLDAIVMISWDELQLWVVRQKYEETSLEQTNATDDAPAYNLLGIPINQTYRGVVISNGKKHLQ
ncbi:MAG: hypothetical protein MJZ88_01135 [Paludibacteraceae bacterium]|nr:hypothetical protein [Candidatus Colicola coprequi]MCQ2333200.1 hypothetical protein [Paludibacteraceae bacterium]